MISFKTIKRSAFLYLLLALASASAQQPDIENCLSTAPDAVHVEYGGKAYLLRDTACKALFETDPERFSQLFDALLEENGTSKPHVPQPKTSSSASLVPS